MASLKLIIKSKSGKIKKEYTEFKLTDKIQALKDKYSRDFNINVNRQRFTFIKPGTDPKNKKNKIALTDETKSFGDYDLVALNNNDKSIELIFKDLGAQISWRTVFLVEYFGPILMHCLCYGLPFLFYPTMTNKSKCLTQKIAFGMTVAHYLKRELETIFVHRFSSATMPAFNIFKNSFHYWMLGGIFISYFLYHPKYTPPLEDKPFLLYGISAVWAVCEIMNFEAHLRLKNLRPPGTKTRGIPKGQLFEYVSCANYFWEIVGWICFSAVTSCATSWLFCVVGAVQMYFWAVKKHRRYRKDFKDYPRNRTALVPFLA